MKLYKNESPKFKKIKRNKFIKKIVFKTTIGIIIISTAILINSKYDNSDVTKVFNNNVMPIETNNTVVTTPPTIEPKSTTTPEVTTNTQVTPKPTTTPKVTTNTQVTPKPTNTPKVTTNTQVENSPITINNNDITIQKVIALSYDDGPSKNLTLEFLKLLKENDCHATFFVLGSQVEKYPSIVNEIFLNGNEIGIHGYDHKSFTSISIDEVNEQIKVTSDAIYNITNEYPAFVRPPYGDINTDIKNQIDYPIALWSIDSEDWKSHPIDTVVSNVLKELKDGKIILMHDIHSKTLEISKLLLPKIKEQGYNIISISELCELKNINLKNGKVYRKVINQSN